MSESMVTWNDEHTVPEGKGWYVVKRADGTLCLRAWGNGAWWIPLPDGWLSGIPEGFSWFGPVESMGWDTPRSYTLLDEWRVETVNRWEVEGRLRTWEEADHARKRHDALYPKTAPHSVKRVGVCDDDRRETSAMAVSP